MGFITGFTGGVALTLSLAYISIAEQQRKREVQSRMLRAQTWTLQSIIDSDEGARQRLQQLQLQQQSRSTASSMEQLAKDRWNLEVERAVRWAQSTDWAAVGQGLERRMAALWGEYGSEKLAEGEAKAKDALDRAKAQASEKLAEGEAKAKDALERTKAQARAKMEDGARRAEDEARRVASRLEDETRRAAATVQDEARRAAAKVEDEASRLKAGAQDEVKGVWSAALNRVRTAVGWSGTDALASAAAEERIDPSNNPVEKALRQRFERRDEVMERAVEEVLRERYRPLEERDNTVLRGL